jgi:hypothetical protein
MKMVLIEYAIMWTVSNLGLTTADMHLHYEFEFCSYETEEGSVSFS